VQTLGFTGTVGATTTRGPRAILPALDNIRRALDKTVDVPDQLLVEKTLERVGLAPNLV
jgi:hypothetical protein